MGEAWRTMIHLGAYGCLLVFSYALVIGIYEEYQEGKSDFFTTKVPLALADYPAILLEFKPWQGEGIAELPPRLEYGTHYILKVQDWNHQNVEVVNLDRREQSLNASKQGNYIEISLLSEVKANYHLVLIDLQKMKKFESDMSLSKTLTIDIIASSLNIAWNTRPIIGFTSMANAHNAAFDEFHDDIDWIRFLHQGSCHHVVLDTFDETKYLRSGKCSDSSFYECLESHLAESTECGGGLCQFVSLPNNLLPTCNSTEHLHCSGDIFATAVANKNLSCRTQKPCRDFRYRYSTDIASQIEGVSNCPNHVLESSGSWAFSVSFRTPKSSRGEGFTRPFKKVHTEYLIWTQTAIIANIGGILGLSLGLSFIGVIVWLTDWAKTKLSFRSTDWFVKLSYVVLTIATAFFVWDMFQEYSEGITSKSNSQDFIKITDNPVVLICFERVDRVCQYNFISDCHLDIGENIFFSVSQRKEGQVRHLDTPITKLEYSYSYGDNYTPPDNYTHRICFKLEPMKNDLTEWVTKVDVWTSFPLFDGRIHFTSEENSNGIISGHSFDGRVPLPARLLFDFPETAIFELTVTESNSIDQQCSDQPFYQCLGSALMNSSEQCKSHGGICSIFTVQNVQLPRCQNRLAHNCSQQVYNQLLDSNECRLKRLCQITEYEYTYNIQPEEYVDDQKKISFEYHFAAPKSYRSRRSNVPRKVVETQHYIWSGLSLTANLGGILSMNIGFSFLMVLELLAVKFQKSCQKSKNLVLINLTYHMLKLGLLILTVFIVRGTYLEYVEGRTVTALEQRPLTTDDNPTLTICFYGEPASQVEYLKQFTARYKYMDKSANNISEWNVDETSVKKLVLTDATKRSCFMFKRLDVDIVGDKKVFLQLIFSNDLAVMSNYDIKAHFTSEVNAYGAVDQMWFDGEVSNLPIDPLKDYFVRLDSVHQYNHHLKGTTCSQRSFYECVAQEMLQSNSCPAGKLCEVVSLPKTVLPSCGSELAYNCSLEAFWAAYNLKCIHEEPCTVVEYKLKDEWWEYELQGEDCLSCGGSVGYSFYAAESSQDPRIKPYKAIHTEYLAWNEMTFAAYLCGTLGLTLGISLLDVYYWMFERVEKFWNIPSQN